MPLTGNWIRHWLCQMTDGARCSDGSVDLTRQGQVLDIRVIPSSRQLIVLELELVLVLGAIHSCLCCNAGPPKANSDQNKTPAIEFEGEDEFEDDFRYLVPQASGTARTKIPSLFTQPSRLFRGLRREKVDSFGAAEANFERRSWLPED